jgi:hypothetical protein
MSVIFLWLLVCGCPCVLRFARLGLLSPSSLLGGGSKVVPAVLAVAGSCGTSPAHCRFWTASRRGSSDAGYVLDVLLFLMTGLFSFRLTIVK